VDIATGRIEKRRPLADNLFGEGITVLDNRLYQLTWRSQIGLVYDIDTFNVLGTFRYRGEGWGLTHDGRHLIMSDGTATLQFLDPTSFEVVERVTVHAGEQPVTRLNELEYVEGEVWANVWYEDRIVRIDPANGEVLGWIDLGNLYTGPGRGGEQVLNGIAFDAETSRLLVTGKNWPQLYEIEVVSQ
jgi:glutamine cyclotransferase